MGRFCFLLTMILLALIPKVALADCSGFIDCMFGFSERVETRQGGMTERARIEAARDTEVERVKGEAAEKLRQADAEVRRVEMAQYQSETDRAVAVAEAQRRQAEYEALIAGLVAQREAEVYAQAQTQIATLQGTTQIAISGITETGKTERWRLGLGFSGVVVVSLVLVVIYLHQRRGSSGPVLVLLDGAQLRRLPVNDRSFEVDDEAIELVPVRKIR